MLRGAHALPFLFASQLFMVKSARTSEQVDRVAHETKAASETSDAVEICGEPDENTLKLLDTPCTAMGFGGVTLPIDEPWGLKPVATSRGQVFPRKYKLPPFRLYVCHPGASRLGLLVSQAGVEEITSKEQMDEVASNLLNNKLWGLKQGFWTNLYAQYKVEIKQSRTDSNVALLWVLDKDGNLLIAPEVQATIHKHGDLTPGRTPLDRPEEKVKDDDEVIGLTCCCSLKTKGSPCGTYYRFVTLQLQNYCCKLRPNGCPSMSKYKPKDLCGNVKDELIELYTEGNFRGVARAGGEIRYPDDGSPPWVHTKSGYSLQRADPESMKTDGAYDSRKLHGTTEIDAIGVCALRRLREYWSQHLKWPVAELRFAAVSFPEGKEVLTDA